MPLDKAKAIEVLLDIVKGTIEVDWITEVSYTPPVPGQPPPDPVRLLNNLTGLVLRHTNILGWPPLKGHNLHSQGSSATLTFCCDRALAILDESP